MNCRPRPMKTSHGSANLDFLRAFAVLSVYVGHLLQTFHIEKIVGRVTIFDVAQTGVLTFFVHTSLVLMLSLERHRETGGRLFTAFYIRRAFRIYPLSILIVVLMFSAHIPAFPIQQYSWPGWGALISNVALTQNLTGSISVPAVLWSLPFEVQMYAVLPVIFVLLRRFRSPWLPICLWVIDVAAISLMLKFKMRAIPGLLAYTPCFLGGIIGYRLWRGSRMRLPFWGWPLAIISCVALRVFAEVSGLRGATMTSSWVACLLLGVAAPQFQELGSGCVRSLAEKIAKCSYGVYLSHCVVFWFAFVLLKNESFWLRSLLCAALSVILPLALYHVIEKPMIDAGVCVARITARQKAIPNLVESWGGSHGHFVTCAED
jgi:peptidoglycan/LPS O-acetylase OafA/YrhL